MSLTLPESYDYCAKLARQAASNFYYTFAMLPTEKRRAMYAIYAYLRELDEIADGHLTTNWQATNAAIEETQQQQLTQHVLQPAIELSQYPWLTDCQAIGQLSLSQIAGWRRLQAARVALEQALAGEITGPVLPALCDTIRRFGIPVEYFTAMMDGMAMDLLGRQYQNWEQLSEYCYHVASVVGLICLHVWGFRDAGAFEPAKACGLAFQLTNILRDLGEDAKAGRVYLPSQDMQHFACQASDLQNATNLAQVNSLIHFQAARAEQLYDQAAALSPLLEKDGARIYAAMHATYYRLLQLIVQQPARVLRERVRVRKWHKAWIAAQAWLSGGHIAKRRFSVVPQSTQAGVTP